MNAKELKKKYIEFFKSKKHVEIKSAPLIPENDPTVLFTTAGMHPLVPFLLGQPHPSGKRLVDFQKCIRTSDIEDVGDPGHLTFFEMLGNWSLGDYFKKEAIEWCYEFLIDVLGLDKEKLSVTVFAGDKDSPRDEESASVWKNLGIPESRIFYLPKADNWWGPAGETGPCGPDTEMFIDTGLKKCGNNCKPGCNCGKYFEIWNSVFIYYNKDKRVILIDGMDCIYDENFNINQELLEVINNFNTHKILVVNGFREKGRNLLKEYIKDDTSLEAFSLEEKGIKKDNPEYFKTLLKRFNLIPEEIIYFDHDKKNVETAMNLGILSKHYTDVKSINKFIEDNLYAYIPLKQKNVDTGMGVERTIAMLQGKKNVYETELFQPLIQEIKKHSQGSNPRAERIISDHIKAATFILAEKVAPSNLGRGYILRRLIRRAIRYCRLIGISESILEKLTDIVINMYKEYYPELVENRTFIMGELSTEEERFNKTLENGIKEFNKIAEEEKSISGEKAFLLFQSYGFPLEMIQELAKELEIKVDAEGFKKAFEEHQKISRVGAEKEFKGGLADTSEMTTRLHTATHLMFKSMQVVLKKENLEQKGANITPERLRFDFNFDRKLTDEEIKAVEELVNKKIKEKIPVSKHEMSLEEAKKLGAHGQFAEKYGKTVFVYNIGEFSKEICGGPHVKNTGELGHFKITKQESVSAGVRRIKAVIE